MDGKRLIHGLRLSGILSFRWLELSLEPLNVLIGPNTSGKSNLLDIIAVLRAAPDKVQDPITKGGGIREWLWKGDETNQAEIDVQIDYPPGRMPLRYELEFEEHNQRFCLYDERIADRDLHGDPPASLYYAYRTEEGAPVLNLLLDKERRLSHVLEEVDADKSILAKHRDRRIYPELTYIAEQFERIRIYRDWNFSRSSAIRKPQQADLTNEFLEDDASNLALVLNRLRNQPAVWRQIRQLLSRFMDGFEDLVTETVGGTIQIFLHESGLATPIPATRLSDGTLQFLSLLTVLCHPAPPPLVCLEEPELGLHPDVIPLVAELLLDAASRMQLVVTTHSAELIDGLSDHPECVVVTERSSDGTRFDRLKPEALQTWLEQYRLGEVWQMGELGGNR